MEPLVVNAEHQNSGLASAIGVLTIEIDPTQRLSAVSSLPNPVDKDSALKLGDAVAGDLKALLGDLSEFGFVIPGAVYDQTNFLRPGFPIAEALEAIFRGTVRGHGYRPQLIALGTASGESFPIDVLNPDANAGPGPLLLTPFALVGPADRVNPVAARLEQVLLHEGVASAGTRDLVQSAFGIRAVHISYATPADLCALLSVQLEQNGFTALWTLLEHGFLDRPGPVSVSLPEGNLFVADGDEVWSPFFTLDQWSSRGPGRDADRNSLQAYIAWTKRQRQYSMALEAHGYSLKLSLPEDEPSTDDDGDAALARLRCSPQLTGDWYCERVDSPPTVKSAHSRIVTRHADAEVGTVAYTIETLDDSAGTLSIEHLYPLVPRGLRGILEAIEQRENADALPQNILTPERIVHDSATLRLRSARDSSTTRETRH